MPLAKRYYAESGLDPAALPFDPDWPTYYAYERAGILRLWTARADGVLIGFGFVQVTHALLHAGTSHAYAGPLWLAPEWRDGLRGLRFLRSVVEACRALGVSVVRSTTNDLYDVGADRRSRVAALFARLGFQQVETVYQKIFQGEEVNDV